MPNSRLLKFYNEDVERVGFVLPHGKIVEVDNIALDPKIGFDVSADDLITYGDDAVATWHTHPGASNNLSTEDMHTFLAWSNLDHYIIGNDGVRKYTVVDGEVLIA